MIPCLKKHLFTLSQVARVPPVGAEGATVQPEGVYDELPPEPTDGGYLSPTDIEKHAEQLGITTTTGNEVDEADQAQLVENMADSGEVVLQVDGEMDSKVSFKKGNEEV